MFQKHKFSPVLTMSVLVVALIALGCSEGSPVLPQTGTTDIQPGSTGQPVSHHLMGAFNITMMDVEDEYGNLVDVEFDVEPLRIGQIHVDVTVFTKPPYCAGSGCMRIVADGVEPGPVYTTIIATVFLTNPTRAVSGYDVRGIIQPPEGEVVLEYADGLTALWSDDAPVPGDFYPYKAFAKDVEMREFGPQTEQAAGYRFRKKNSYKLVNMLYKIDVSFPSNANEPVGCYVPPLTGGIHPEGSNAYILAVITDWQNDLEEDAVTITLDPMFGVGSAQQMEMISSDPVNHITTWQYHLTYGAGYPEGDRTMRIIARDPVEVDFPYAYDFTVRCTYDDDPPDWKNPDQKGIYDHIAGPDLLYLFFHEADDTSLPLEYIFHGSDWPDAFTEDNQLRVITSDQYVGYTAFGPIASPPNVLRWFGINLKDAQGNYDIYEDIMDYSCTRYSVEARWSLLKGQNPGRDGIFGSPTIGDVNGDGMDDIVVGTKDYHVYVFEGDGTGTFDTTLWEYETGAGIECTPALADLNGDNKLDVVFASDDVNVYAISGASTGGVGQELWVYDAGDQFLMHSSPAIAQFNSGAYDVVIGTGDAGLIALNGEDGSEIWTFPCGGIAGTPAVADVNGDDVADVCVGSYDTWIYMVDGASGGEIWSYYMGPGFYNVDCPPVLVNVNADPAPDCIIGARDNVGETTGVVLALDGRTGDEIWTQGEIWGNPRRQVAPVRINDDDIFDFIVTAWQTENFSVYALDGATGAFIYKKIFDPTIDPTEPFNYTAPVIGDFTGDGHLNAIYGREDGYCDLICIADLDLPGEEWRALRFMQVSSGTKKEINGTPAVGDVDNDGEWELVAANNRGWVYVLDLHAPVPEDISLRGWTQHAGNRWHTGTPEFEPPDG